MYEAETGLVDLNKERVLGTYRRCVGNSKFLSYIGVLTVQLRLLREARSNRNGQSAA